MCIRDRAEAAGYPVAYAATYDLEFLPNLLTPYDVVVIAGHSEYWTWDMRQRVRCVQETACWPILKSA